MLHTLLYVALAGTRLVQNDNFTGSGTVNSAVSFPEYAGAGVVFTPDGGYPLKIIGIDVLSVGYSTGSSGEIGAYQWDLWREADGPITPPNRAALRTGSVQFTTSASVFNRIDFQTTPITVASGRVFVNVSEQTSTAMDSTTIAIDTAPLVPGANWWRFGGGGFTPLELPDGGFYNGINHNWIIRLVLEVPDQPVTVTSVFPNSGVNTMPTAVVISGTNFEFTSKAYVGTNALTVTSRSGTTSISATVPAGLPPATYPVKVENSPTAFGTLMNAFTVLLGDGGMGTGGGAGGASGGGTGGSGGSGGSGGAGGTGGSGGGPVALRLDEITPNDAYSQETTKVVLTGAGFETGAEVLIGPRVLDVVTVKSQAVINAEVPPGIRQGTYDVTVLNLDGQRAEIKDGFTVYAGVRTKQGCGCGVLSLEPLLALAVLAASRRKTSASRR